MNNEEVRVRLETALRKLEERDSYLFENDLSETLHRGAARPASSESHRGLFR